MKKLKLFTTHLLLSFTGLFYAQENTSAETIISPQNSTVEPINSTIPNSQQISVDKLSSLDIKALLNLSEEQQKQYAETEEQYITLRSQLASQGEERALLESKIDALEKRQISNILNDQQLEKFNEVWDLKKKVPQETIQEVEQTLTQEQAEQMFTQTIID